MHTCGTISPEMMATALKAVGFDSNGDVNKDLGRGNDWVGSGAALTHDAFQTKEMGSVFVPRVNCTPPVADAKWVWIILPSGTEDSATRQIRITELAAYGRTEHEHDAEGF
ncbi:unnamed protein product [Amoebophrya sp. A120]|nr:unnamed protein product [Amoebophrya sp. A120]|eukprot:GSA120T00016319001.1